MSPARDPGVGLVYWPALAPVFRSGACAALELEPQSLWEKSVGSGGCQYRLNEALFDDVVQLPQHKLMHGVGQPVGGTTDDPVEHGSLLRWMADRLDVAWVSEHLSFNRVSVGGAVLEAGFLLPPVQSRAAVRTAADNIGRYAQALGRPFAFETGVNYLGARDGELADGEFFAAVARHAGCGILLDLHNLWCNERNGRQPARAVLAQLPLERVWEVHLAGGMSHRGYWLDAHSAATPPEVLELAAELVPRLENLGALIFEVLPEHLPALGLDGVVRELERLNALWRLRPARRVAADRRACPSGPGVSPEDRAEVQRAERRLHAALTAGGAAGGGDDGADPGYAVLRELIDEFRSANLAKALRYTLTALLAGVGRAETRGLLGQYFRATPPDAFPALEAEHFGQFLAGRREVLTVVPYLGEILAFERALVAATVRGESTELAWSVDPTALFAELDGGRLPRDLPKSSSQMRVAAS